MEFTFFEKWFTEKEPKELSNDEELEESLRELMSKVKADATMTPEKKIEELSRISKIMSEISERKQKTSAEKHRISNNIVEVAKALGPTFGGVIAMIFINLWEQKYFQNKNMFSVFMELFKGGLRKQK